jgi:hypothetical protein
LQKDKNWRLRSKKRSLSKKKRGTFPSAAEHIPTEKSIKIGGNVVDSVVIVGNENTVN